MLPVSRKTTTKWNLVFNYLSILLTFVTGVVMVPVYLKFLPLPLYGAWLATGNILIWLTAIDPGLATVIQQQIGVAYGQKGFRRIGELIVGGILINGLITLVICLVGLVFADPLIGWIDLPDNVDTVALVDAFEIAVVGTSLMVFSYTFIGINQGLQSSIANGSIFVVVNILKVVLTVVLLYRGYGLAAVAIPIVFTGIGLTIGNAVYMGWRLFREKIGLCLSMGKILGLVKLLSFTFVGRASSVIAFNMDLFFTARFLGPETAAILNLTQKAPQMSRMLVERPAVAFMPSVSHLIGSGETEKAKNFLLRLLRLLLWLLGLFTGGFVAFNDDFVRIWVGGHLFAGQTINVVLIASFFVAVTVSALANLVFACGNIKGTSLSGLVQSLLFVPLIILGSQHFGLLGVALAPLISTLAVQGWYLPYLFSKTLKLSHQDRTGMYREVLNVAIVLVPITMCGMYFRCANWAQFFFLTVLYGILYCGGLFMLSKECRAEMRGFAQKLATRFMIK